MPSVEEKAFQYSIRSVYNRRNSIFSARKSFKANTRSWINRLPQLRFDLVSGLGGRLDMPVARKTQEKTSFEQQERQKSSNKLSKEKSDKSGAKKNRNTLFSEEPAAEGKSSSTATQSTTDIDRRQVGSAKGYARASSVTQGLDARYNTAGSTRQTLTVASTPYIQGRLNDQIRQRKKQIVDKLMAALLECLEKKLEPFEEPCDGEGCSSRSHGSSNGKNSSNSKRPSTGKKRQHQSREDEDNDSENDEDENRRNGNGKRTKTSQNDDDQRYACPYYKFDRERFGQMRTCCGPGWSDLHRLKEHLDRRHALPKFKCNRCLEEFKKKEELSKHQRAATSCHLKEVEGKLSPRNIADGYDKAQEEKLSKRSRNKPGHEKWAEWYCILFNLDPAIAEIPSPWYGVADSDDWRHGHSDRSKYGEWADYMRQELPPRLRVYLEAEVDRAMDGVEQKLRSTVRKRVRGMALSLHRIFQAIPPPPEISASQDIQELAGTFAVPPNLDLEDIFADYGADIDQAIGPDNEFGEFEFSFDVAGTDLGPSSTSSCSSDSNFMATTSDTSVEEDNTFAKNFRLDIPDMSSAPIVYNEFPISFVDHNSSYGPTYHPNDG